jgi:hypothetical protein
VSYDRTPRNLDKEDLPISDGRADMAIECLRTLTEIRDMIAQFGEQRLSSVLFMAIPEEGDIVGHIAGDTDALLDALMKVYSRIPLVDEASS